MAEQAQQLPQPITDQEYITNALQFLAKTIGDPRWSVNVKNDGSLNSKFTPQEVMQKSLQAQGQAQQQAGGPTSLAGIMDPNVMKMIAGMQEQQNVRADQLPQALSQMNYQGAMADQANRGPQRDIMAMATRMLGDKNLMDRLRVEIAGKQNKVDSPMTQTKLNILNSLTPEERRKALFPSLSKSDATPLQRNVEAMETDLKKRGYSEEQINQAIRNKWAGLTNEQRMVGNMDMLLAAMLPEKAQSQYFKLLSDAISRQAEQQEAPRQVVRGAIPQQPSETAKQEPKKDDVANIYKIVREKFDDLIVGKPVPGTTGIVRGLGAGKALIQDKDGNWYTIHKEDQ